jgi:hypothetical protein
MHAKTRRRLTPAQTVHHHRAPDPGIEFHCEHPSSPPMPRMDIEKAYQDPYTLAPPLQRRLNTGSVVHFAAAVYTECSRTELYQPSIKRKQAIFASAWAAKQRRSSN